MHSPIDFVRKKIENEIFNHTGITLKGVSYDLPKGDPGLFGPDSACWQVHRDFTSMLSGGFSALLLQMLHPLALAGVWDHSNFRDDMLGRLKRTAQFVAATTFGNTNDAHALIAKVRFIHEQVEGVTPDGQHYSAMDPELLTWVHVAEASSFLKARQHFFTPVLSSSDHAELCVYSCPLSRIAPQLEAGVNQFFEIFFRPCTNMTNHFCCRDGRYGATFGQTASAGETI